MWLIREMFRFVSNNYNVFQNTQEKIEKFPVNIFPFLLVEYWWSYGAVCVIATHRF